MERVRNLLTISTVFLMVLVSDHVKGARTIKEDLLGLAARPPAAGLDPGTPPRAGGSFPFPGFSGIPGFNFGAPGAGGFGGLPPIPGFVSGLWGTWGQLVMSNLAVTLWQPPCPASMRGPTTAEP